MTNRANFVVRRMLCIGMLLLVLLCTIANAGKLEHAKVNFWKDSTFHQKTVGLRKYDEGIIRAKVYVGGGLFNYKWQEFKIRELPDKFMDWDIEIRKETLERIKKNQPPSWAGPHNAMVASYGIRRFDTQFAINNAVKGMGFVPKKNKIKEIINRLESTIDSSFSVKLGILEHLYNNANEIFDRTKQISLELYSTPEFETHTFLNEMMNPAVAIVFLDIPCFELKAIAQLLHPADPELTEYEKDAVKYVNLIHSYFHGGPKEYIGVIYHIIEVYDNSPGKGGKGIRIVPSIP
jgi:hypothetical protein